MSKKRMKLIRFDWAMKRMLRDKANFVVLEGFLSVLLGEKIKIKTILSSQSNKEDKDDKYNDVDVLVEKLDGELIIVEVQNAKQYDFFHRILFGAAKAITEYIEEGEAYENVKKIISVTIAYFDLGQGKDYVYHGKNEFKGIHEGDILTLSDKQKELYNKSNVYEIYPEYWIIKAGLFDEAKVNDKLDEWIFFLKTGEVREDFTADGLPEAKVKLDKMKLSPEERIEYNEYIKQRSRNASYQLTEIRDIKDLVEKEKIKERLKTEERKDIEAILNFFDNGVPIPIIAKSLNKSEEIVEKIINNRKKYE